MVSDIIERYVHDALNARAVLEDGRSPGRHALARQILGDVMTYFADHLDDVVAARDRIAVRHDSDGVAMLTCIDIFLSTYATASDCTNALLIRASRRPRRGERPVQT